MSQLRLRVEVTRWLLGGGVTAAAAGALVTTPSGPEIILALIGLALVIAFVQSFGLGVAIGLCVLGGLDALPGPNLETSHLALSATVQDGVVILLILVLLINRWWSPPPPGRQGRFEVATLAWATVFLALWLTTMFITVLTTSVPLEKAAFFVRYFAYFAILLPCLVRPLSDVTVRRTFYITCATGALVAALAQTLASLGVPLGFLVHATRTTTSFTLTRVYTGATSVPVAALPFSTGFALFARSRRIRWVGGVVAIVSAAAVLLSQTRALYVGEILGLALASILWLAVGDSGARVGRRQVGRLSVIVGIVVLLFSFYSPPQVVDTALGGVVNRAATILPTLTGQAVASSSSLAFRNVEAAQLVSTLGGHWLFGLGFLNPSSHYVPSVPRGSITNSDLGYLNIVMTMGIVGALLYTLPVVAVPILLAYRRLTRQCSPLFLAEGFGVLAWAVAVLASAKDLIIMYSPTGVVSCAAVLALGIGALARPETGGSFREQDW